MKNSRSRISDLAEYKQRKLGTIRRTGTCLNGIEDLLVDLEDNSDLPGVSTLIQMLWATHDSLSQTFDDYEGED